MLIDADRTRKVQLPVHLPPVILLGIDTPIGLNVLRELGEHNVPVYGFAWDRTALGLYSRHLVRGLVRARGDAAFRAQLCELIGELSDCVVMAISENDLLWLGRNASAMAPARVVAPKPEVMDRVLNKEITYEFARQAGVPIVRSYIPSSLEDAIRQAPTLEYPVVVKWSNPHRVAHLLSAAGIPLDKARYCRDAKELVEYLNQFEAIGQFPLVQTYCAGIGMGQFIFMDGGKPIRKFQHIRVREWPPEGGVSCVCESIALTEHTDLMSKSVQLLQSVGWQGPAMVEYRYDPLTGRAALMEINGRYWGSFPLAYHSKAEFAWLSYCVQGLGVEPPLSAIRNGLRCRFLIPELKRLAKILFASRNADNVQQRYNKWKEVRDYVTDFLNPRTRYYIFNLHDLKPWFMDLYFVFRKVMRLRAA
jgi:predicted ATP-grasp superfamily ATP-dependent carboligase